MQMTAVRDGLQSLQWYVLYKSTRLGSGFQNSQLLKQFYEVFCLHKVSLERYFDDI